MKIVEIYREQLYQEVWATPIQRLAKEKYGISDRGLGKICSKLNVPTPPRGYWAKVQNGQKIRVTPLPKPKKDTPAKYLLHGRYPEKAQKELNVDPDAHELIMELQKPENKAAIPMDLRGSHPLIRKTKDDLAERIPDDSGRLNPGEVSCLAIFVSKESIRRSLLIMAALLAYFKSKGFPVYAERNNMHVNVVEIFGEKVTYTLREKFKTHERPEEERGWKKINGKLRYLSRYCYENQGNLSLKIETYRTDRLRKSWNDSKLKKLEEKLTEALIGFIAFADAERRERRERERWRQEQAEKERIRAEQRRQQEIEQKRIQILERQARDWAFSKHLREYIAQVEIQARDRALEPDIEQGLNKWLFWANKYADRVDPFKDQLLSIIDPISCAEDEA